MDTSRVNEVTITSANEQQRLDNFLISALKGAPKSLIYRVIRKGEVRVNKKRAKADTRLLMGDVVRIPPVRLPARGETPEVSKTLAKMLQSSIVFEDESLMVINKPHGIAVHGGSGINLGLIEALRKLRPDHSYLELVHRLDRDTSGLVMIAKNRKALTVLQRMLANKRGIVKKYIAIVHGRWNKTIDSCDKPLLRTERKSGERIVVVDQDGKPSLTKFKLLSTGRDYSVIGAEPITGRTHQIRVHCLSHGHIIAGDQKYSSVVDAEGDRKHGITRLCLHAYSLSFNHPISGGRLNLIAPLDEEFSNILNSTGCSLVEREQLSSFANFG